MPNPFGSYGEYMKVCFSCENVKETAYLTGMKDVRHLLCTDCQVTEAKERAIGNLVAQAHATAVEKGWWDKPRSTLECIALMHCELSEAVEAYRKGDEEHVVEELADVLIRVFDLCGHRGWNLERSLRIKMEFNKTRAYRHGGKLA